MAQITIPSKHFRIPIKLIFGGLPPQLILIPLTSKTGRQVCSSMLTDENYHSKPQTSKSCITPSETGKVCGTVANGKGRNQAGFPGLVQTTGTETSY